MPDVDPELDALSERYNRNREWAKRGSYQTKLSPGLEQEFRGWVFKNQIPYDTSWPPDQAMQDYDMRGFWKAMKANDPQAVRDPQTGHFPDRWKTPYHETFSDQSIYAAPGAPRWSEGRLMDKTGNVLWGGTAKLTPDELAVQEDLDPELNPPMPRVGSAMRRVSSANVDYRNRAQNKLVGLSPDEEDYWTRYAQGLINPGMTGAGLMKEAQRVAPMPEISPGVPSQPADYTSWFLDPKSWNYRVGRQGYGR